MLDLGDRQAGTLGDPAQKRLEPPRSGGGRVWLWDRFLARRLLAQVKGAPIRLVLWDGRGVEPQPDETPIATVHFKDRLALYLTALRPDPCFAEAYTAERVEVEGDLVRLLEAVYEGQRSTGAGARSRWLRRPNTLKGSRRNIHHHYDIGNDFYHLWLDDQLVYTCAYFPDPNLTLEAAQIAKLDYVCRKLRLEPGQTVFEAGCGWGALAMHMARHYGVKVRAFNISHEQVAYARRRARIEGLESRVEFIEDDYRRIDGVCDAFVSVGMLEHVGPEHYRDLGRVIDRCLKPQGLGLIHSIGRHRPMPSSRWIAQRIFPGAYPPTLRQMMDLFEPWDLCVLDVENLRLHYARTLHHWLARFDRAEDEVERMLGRRFVRTWRLYLAGSEAAFTTGQLQLYQIVFARAANRQVPWTRAHLYLRDQESHAGSSSSWNAATP